MNLGAKDATLVSTALPIVSLEGDEIKPLQSRSRAALDPSSEFKPFNQEQRDLNSALDLEATMSGTVTEESQSVTTIPSARRLCSKPYIYYEILTD